MKSTNKVLIACALLAAAQAHVQAACPSSVTVGSPDSPVEIAEALKGDAAFASMHLNNINRMLPRARESCQKGVANNCRLANFLAEAKAGLECYAGIVGDTAGQMRSGSARDMSSENAGGVAGRSGHSARMSTQGSNSQLNSAARFQSQDATTCVEIVPNGFKCEGNRERYLTNICSAKITVLWRLGNDSWAQQDLAPSKCYPVSYYKDDRAIQYRACSWDAKANHGPYMDRCRY